MVSEILFWMSFGILIYAYLGYPLLCGILVRIKRTFNTSPFPVRLDVFTPPISLIIAAFNEEVIIEEKIINSLELNYPQDLIDLIFITDGSTDGSAAIISRFPRIRLLHQPLRQGKLAAMNRAVDHAINPFLVFSDANAFINKDSLSAITRHYADSRVGAVAGEKKIQSTPRTGSVKEGEGLYWRYESLLKKLDSDLYTTVGAAGELFSIRKELYKKLPENTIIEDFVQSLLVCADGFVVRYEPEAFSFETASPSIKAEMERKIRISAGAFQAMRMLRKLFNPFRDPLLWFQFISHRILRWTLCPLALLLLFPLSIYLSRTQGGWFYDLITIGQLAFYAAALAGWLLARRNILVKPLYLAFYFLFMHLCVFMGFYRYIRRNQTVLWNKAERKQA